MKILLLCTAYNGLTQRVHDGLINRKHQVVVELAISAENMVNAVVSAAPDLILCPFLKQVVPEKIWMNHTCIIIHPGIVGDRGPSSLDWAIQNGNKIWGVTALQADAEMDAGDIWATKEFPIRACSKASLYRQEVNDAAVACIDEVLAKFMDPEYVPRPLDYGDASVKGRLMPTMKQTDRALDWTRQTTDEILVRIRAADSFPGVRDILFGRTFFLYGAHRENELTGLPGEVIARRHGAICRATIDGAIWISHLREAGSAVNFKLPATQLLSKELDGVRTICIDPLTPKRATFQEISYEEANGVGYLAFDFHNGAMNTEQCRRLKAAYLAATSRPTRVLALMGGSDFWSNGIHLNAIEAADDPAEES